MSDIESYTTQFGYDLSGNLVKKIDKERNPIVAKVGGLLSQGVKGEAVVNLLRTLDNAGSGVLRLSAA